MTLIDHLEKHLGAISRGWTNPSDRASTPFQVVEFDNGPINESIVYSTLGLSDFALKSPVSDKVIPQELVLIKPTATETGSVPSLLQQLGSEAIGNDRAYVRGEIIGPRGRLFPEYEYVSLYVAMPVYLPDSFCTFRADNGIETVFAWLIPVTLTETEFILKNGWRSFEERLEQINPDLVDLDRESVV